MARWDPDKRWLGAVEIVAEMKREGLRPLLLARGGAEPHGDEVWAAVRARGLSRVDRKWSEPGSNGLLNALRNINGADVVNLQSPVDPESRRMLFRGSAVVLANSAHEPFGLVGLETMAAGGLACTGCSGEEYAIPGQNALVLETGNPHELLGMFQQLRTHPQKALALRRAGRQTAKKFTWPEIVQRILVPQLEIIESVDAPRSATGSIEPDPPVGSRRVHMRESLHSGEERNSSTAGSFLVNA
jgi:glycosyltransferase involved in cell wall biosynthesis